MNIQEILVEMKSKKMNVLVCTSSYSDIWNVTVSVLNSEGDQLSISAANRDLELAVLSAYSRINERMNSVFMTALPKPEVDPTYDMPF